MTDLLKRLDYVYKKPKVLPGKHPDPQVQQAFIEKYETLKQNKGKDNPIYFMDGVHPRHNPVAAFGWIKRGLYKTLENNTGRKRVNINGAVAIESLDVEVDFAESVNAQSTISLLSKLEAKHEKADMIYIIQSFKTLFLCSIFVLANRNLLICSILRSFSIRRTFWLRPRAKPEAALGSLCLSSFQ